MPAIAMNRTPTLAQLLHGFADAPDVPVSGIATDSRCLREGFVFLACRGQTSHGLDFLQQAKAAGVVAIVWEAGTYSDLSDIGIPMIPIADLPNHLGEIANRFYGNPSSALHTVGITGTNGKTTVAWMIAQCRHLLGERCAYIGTLGSGVDELDGDSRMTTPANVELHGRLADFVDVGATHAALEVSSHALLQGRVDGVSFDVAMFTNLTRDHLDYHGDMRSYFEAKEKLFFDHGAALNIVNIDSPFGNQLAERCGDDVVIVSADTERDRDSRAFVIVESSIANERGSTIAFSSSWGSASFELAMPGDFNVANAALVLAYLLATGVDIEMACDVLQVVVAPAGRMQRVPGCVGSIYVDYAHTPDALESALQALRPHCRGELWCVFGCGGDRDIGKRPMMAAAAERNADRVIVTSDNPRSEDPAAIIRNIMTGFRRQNGATVIEDRATAVSWVISHAAANDTVLVAGKGHENYQEIDGERLPFSDYSIAKAAAKRKEGGS